MIKNSDDVYAVILYTGVDTKLTQNQGKYQFKVSKLQRSINKYIIINIITLIIYDILCSQWGHRVWHARAIDDPDTPELEENHYYLFPSSDKEYSNNKASLEAILTYYLLFNGFLPLNMNVMNSLAKFIYVYMLNNDPQMINEEKSVESGHIKGCKVKNMELIQDFAMINHLFCDKTGTLTKNILIFRCMMYENKLLEVKKSDFNEFKIVITKIEAKDKFLDFWRCICLCHDVSQVLVEGKTGKVETYQGASIDEVNFLEMAKAVDYVRFVQRDNDSITIKVRDDIEKYKILKVIDFDSDRKRMSMVVKREGDGKVYNFMKGADFAILPRLKEGEEEDNQETINMLDEQANKGLRTLMFAMKELDPGTTVESLKDTPEVDLEQGITFLGGTGLEDLLQDNVAKCIRDFREADIKVWMLTGDKKETAKNIAISCGLLDVTNTLCADIKGETVEEIKA